MKNNIGFDVKIEYAKQSAIYKSGRKSDCLHNVSEIHYNYHIYPSVLKRQIAFESDIHETGLTYYVDDIKEFEATESKKINKEF